MHAQLVLEVPDPVQPTSSDQVIGVDAGVVIAVAVSDGREFHMPDETDLNNQIKTLQQSRARCTYGSRRWNRRSDHLRGLYERRSHLRGQADRRIAKTIATTVNVCAVGAEITNNKALMASAAGTAEHPSVSVAAKRTLNRLLHSSRFAGVRNVIERACAIVGKLYVPVAAAGTSSMCHRCGGQRYPRKPSGVPMPRLWLGRQRRLQRSAQRRPSNLHPSLNRLGAEKSGGRGGRR